MGIFKGKNLLPEGANSFFFKSSPARSMKREAHISVSVISFRDVFILLSVLLGSILMGLTLSLPRVIIIGFCKQRISK